MIDIAGTSRKIDKENYSGVFGELCNKKQLAHAQRTRFKERLPVISKYSMNITIRDLSRGASRAI